METTMAVTDLLRATRFTLLLIVSPRTNIQFKFSNRKPINTASNRCSTQRERTDSSVNSSENFSEDASDDLSKASSEKSAEKSLEKSSETFLKESSEETPEESSPLNLGTSPRRSLQRNL